MSIDPREIRRIDIGRGIYVRVRPAADGSAAGVTPQALPSRRDDATRRWNVPTAAFAVGAALMAIALLRIGVTERGVFTAAVLSVLAVLAGIDLRWRLLPNRILLPALVLVLAWHVALSPGRTVEWVLAALGAALFLLVPSLVRRDAIGMGDVKLGALLGAALGADVRLALTLGFLALVPAALLTLRRSGRQATLPLGPCLALGAAVVLLA
jgi:leader peptidase (prepilin peptidase) / N-methyltransferase